ncbi:hypothetical protein [Burkholderia anthina]|uniref:hypothetical protein n=1 Tax=Burkholderia anthina TaxID=179879 RepID=UPI00158E7DAC|nr:hypothetical protein [Burkholderia anthina]
MKVKARAARMGKVRSVHPQIIAIDGARAASLRCIRVRRTAPRTVRDAPLKVAVHARTTHIRRHPACAGSHVFRAVESLARIRYSFERIRTNFAQSKALSPAAFMPHNIRHISLKMHDFLHFSADRDASVFMPVRFRIF